jgi:hypothetical protein
MPYQPPVASIQAPDKRRYSWRHSPVSTTAGRQLGCLLNSAPNRKPPKDDWQASPGLNPRELQCRLRPRRAIFGWRLGDERWVGVILDVQPELGR